MDEKNTRDIWNYSNQYPEQNNNTNDQDANFTEVEVSNVNAPDTSKIINETSSEESKKGLSTVFGKVSPNIPADISEEDFLDMLDKMLPDISEDTTTQEIEQTPLEPKESFLESEETFVYDNNMTSEIFDVVQTAICALVAVVLIFTFLFRIVGVDGTSMVPTLQNNDYVLITDFFYKPKVGDIVVINLERFNKPIIKRIVAMEGDVVDIDDQNGQLYVNGNLIIEEYVNSPTFIIDAGQSYPLTVSEGSVFVMGDNRGGSTDSRRAYVGCIDKKLILGTAFFRVYPFNTVKRIGNEHRFQ